MQEKEEEETMAVDYIVGGLILSSAAVNILALCAFWISPGLRTTANRFVINLLIVNVAACTILIPSLFLNGGLRSNFIIDDSDLSSNEMIMTPSQYRHHHHHQHHSRIPSVRPINLIDEQSLERELIHSIESAVIEREEQLKEKISRETETISQDFDCTRFWGFDAVAALGKFR